MKPIDPTPSIPPPNPPHPNRAWAWKIVGVALFLFTLSAFVPWNLPPPPGDLDVSWNVVLHWAHLHHLDFGRQIIFTFGPWGFVLLRYLPVNFGSVVAAWTLISAGFFAAIWTLSKKFSSRFGAALWLLLVITLAATPIRQFQDIRMSAMSWLLLLIHFYVDDRPWKSEKMILSIGMAWVSLIKFSVIFMCFPVLAVVTLDQLIRRRIPSTLIVFIAAYLGLWLIAWQPLSSLGPYLEHSWALAGGYTEGVAYSSSTELTDVTLYLAAAAMLFAMVCLARPRSLLGAAGLLAILFLVFKTGYVRHDSHEIIATGSLTLMALTFGAAIWPQTNRAARVYIVLLSACLLTLTSRSEQVGMDISAPELAAKSLAQIPDSAAAATEWATGASAFQNAYENQRQSLPSDLASQIDGTVDTYSGGQKMLLDSAENYNPRPLFQSYLTYVSALSKLNADFLASENAPQTILFDTEPIDGHYPSEEEALSWPQLLTRYDLKDASGDRLVLRRSPQPRDFQLNLLDHRTAPMNQWIGVPASDGPVWVQLQIRLTALGRLMRAIYKVPTLTMTVDHNGQRIQSFQLMRDVAAAGFLLSPQISDRVGFAMLYSNDWKDVLGDFQVAHIAITAGDSGTSACFDPNFDVSFYDLQFPHQDISAVPGAADSANLTRLVGKMTVVQSDASLMLASDDGGKMVLLAPAMSRLMFPVPPGATGLDIGFGIMHSQAVHSDPNDAVTFRVYTAQRLTSGGINIVPLWTRPLDPTLQPPDRGLQTAHIPLPASPQVSNVLLEVEPNGPHAFIPSYWTDVQFH